METEIEMDNAVITIDDQPTILKICNEKFYWWFKLWNHNHPNTEDYIFTGDLLTRYFPDLAEKMEE